MSSCGVVTLAKRMPWAASRTPYRQGYANMVMILWVEGRCPTFWAGTGLRPGGPRHGLLNGRTRDRAAGAASQRGGVAPVGPRLGDVAALPGGAGERA